MISGKFATDHNDFFLFYVFGSFWTWFEYEHSKNKKWLILIGLFAGGATLVKWLMGLLIYVIWGFVKFTTDFKNTLRIQSYIPILTAFAISMLVFLPWQIYIFTAFTKEATDTYIHNLRHLSEGLESHGETIFYYFGKGFDFLYGSFFLTLPLFVSGIVFLVFKTKRISYKITIAFSYIFLCTFFFLASTRMIGFMLIIALITYIGLGALVHCFIQFIQKKVKLSALRILGILIPLILAVLIFEPERLLKYHSMKHPEVKDRAMKIKEKEYIDELNTKLNDGKYIIFNANITPFGYIPFMYFTDHIAYHFIPEQERLDMAKNSGYKVAFIRFDSLPNYITQDTSIQILECTIKRK